MHCNVITVNVLSCMFACPFPKPKKGPCIIWFLFKLWGEKLVITVLHFRSDFQKLPWDPRWPHSIILDFCASHILTSQRNTYPWLPDYSQTSRVTVSIWKVLFCCPKTQALPTPRLCVVSAHVDGSLTVGHLYQWLFPTVTPGYLVVTYRRDDMMFMKFLWTSRLVF